MKIYSHRLLSLCILAAGLCFSLHTANASPVSLEAGVTYAHVSGTWSPDWSYVPRKNDTSSLAVPYLRLACSLTSEWNLGLSYSYYSGINASGTTGNAPLQPGQNPTGLVFPAWSEQKLHELSVDLRYSFYILDRVGIEVGPVLSTSFATLNYWQQGSGVPVVYPPNNNFKSTRLNLGGVAALRIPLNENCSAALTYRYAETAGLKLQHFGAAVAYRF
jgi:hypothetical protein